MDDATPETDEILLRVLTDEIKAGRAPTPGEILAKARQLEPETFQRWQSSSVSRALKRYGLVTGRSDGTRPYNRVTLGDLRKIQATYGIGLDIKELPEGLA